jgi:3-methyl-2-oxobutanoate hydroxymethyltransferase
MGLFNKFTPRFVKRYAELEPVMRRAAGRYAKDVRQGSFPGRRHEFSMDDGERARFEALMASSAKKAGLK